MAWLIGSPNPNHYVEITDLFDRKLAALRAHASQTAHRDRLAEELRDRLDAMHAEGLQSQVT